MNLSRSHVGIAEFKVLNWIPLSERAKQINLCKVYSVVHGSAPKYLKTKFFMVSERHSISTRHTVQLLVLPHVKSSGAKTFFFSASNMWNALTAHPKSAPSGTTFKRGLMRDHICMKMGRWENYIFIYGYLWDNLYNFEFNPDWPTFDRVEGPSRTWYYLCDSGFPFILSRSSRMVSLSMWMLIVSAYNVFF